MYLQINDVFVMFQAIESFVFDEEAKELVVRTVSGAEHRHPALDRDAAEALIDRTHKRMAMWAWKEEA